ncbi:DUF2905 domain-containing protein [Fervidobacterium thailandense]|uniref:DUF2905 domain-containing protein n=1 Tax=Fervidobacterium thailandense TaxID=1008305 RepID=UPI001F4EC028|nr:DUF2905 domain-containing protein [Fervidobacterium thailandense]
MMIIAGLIMYLIPKMNNLRWLPGDIVIRRKNFVFIFPITTMIIVSVVLTVILNIISKLLK